MVTFSRFPPSGRIFYFLVQRIEPGALNMVRQIHNPWATSPWDSQEADRQTGSVELESRSVGVRRVPPASGPLRLSHSSKKEWREGRESRSREGRMGRAWDLPGKGSVRGLGGEVKWTELKSLRSTSLGPEMLPWLNDISEFLHNVSSLYDFS